MLPPYTKPHLSFADQLLLLTERGLIVTDRPNAIRHLQRIGYGRLALYWQPLQKTKINPLDPAHPILLDDFRSDAQFSHAVDLYLFDKQLRLLFLDAIERIEVALRVDIAHELGRRDPWAHRSPAFLDNHRANSRFGRTNPATRHQTWLEKADTAIARSREEWVSDFSKTYSSPVPIWMAVEAWDYGTLSWLLEMAHPNDRTTIAKRYGLLPDTLVSWVKSLNYVRNICAHHARLWNTGIINQPKIPRMSEAAAVFHIRTDPIRQHRVYGASAIASHLVDQISTGSSWGNRMRDHWLAFPAIPFVTPVQAGFLAGWDKEVLWA